MAKRLWKQKKIPGKQGTADKLLWLPSWLACAEEKGRKIMWSPECCCSSSSEVLCECIEEIDCTVMDVHMEALSSEPCGPQEEFFEAALVWNPTLRECTGGPCDEFRGGWIGLIRIECFGSIEGTPTPEDPDPGRDEGLCVGGVGMMLGFLCCPLAEPTGNKCFDCLVGFFGEGDCTAGSSSASSSTSDNCGVCGGDSLWELDDPVTGSNVQCNLDPFMLQWSTTFTGNGAADPGPIDAQCDQDQEIFFTFTITCNGESSSGA